MLRDESKFSRRPSVAANKLGQEIQAMGDNESDDMIKFEQATDYETGRFNNDGAPASRRLRQ